MGGGARPDRLRAGREPRREGIARAESPKAGRMTEGITMTSVIDVAPARKDAKPIEKNSAVRNIQKLTASYGRKPAISDVAMEVYGNVITAVIAPYGCGKSTFIRFLNRMIDLVPR